MSARPGIFRELRTVLRGLEHLQEQLSPRPPVQPALPRGTRRRKLAILPNLRAPPGTGGRIVLTKKFIEGMEESRRHWDGPVCALLEPSETRTSDLDQIEVHPSDLPFELEVLPYDSPVLRERLERCAIVSAGISSRVNHLAALCESLGIPLVYTSELSLPTRVQIIDAAPIGSLRKASRSLWAIRQEWRQIEAIRHTPGIQCNGTPTYEAYEELTPDPLLFFDSRMRAQELIDEHALIDRLDHSGERLHLVFSGRLDRIKGVDHLPKVADALRRAQVPFELNIFGGGEMEQELAREIARLHLEREVILRGAIDFHRELVPTLEKDADLFVCCHRQGDPSCTYLETLGCGVPIVGYGNDALTGILEGAHAGSTVRMDDPEELAAEIARLAHERARLRRWSVEAIEFARRHSFEVTMKQRMNHLARIAFDGERPGPRYRSSGVTHVLDFALAAIPGPSGAE